MKVAVQTARNYGTAGSELHFIGVMTPICGQAEKHVLGSLSVPFVDGQAMARFMAEK